MTHPLGRATSTRSPPGYGKSIPQKRRNPLRPLVLNVPPITPWAASGALPLPSGPTTNIVLTFGPTYRLFYYRRLDTPLVEWQAVLFGTRLLKAGTPGLRVTTPGTSKDKSTINKVSPRPSPAPTTRPTTTQTSRPTSRSTLLPLGGR